MKTEINDEVSVVMYYSARKQAAMPHIISWQNREYTVRELGYHHTVMDGRVLHHIFELTVKEAELWMRLDLNTSNLHWLLEAVSNGLAT